MCLPMASEYEKSILLRRKENYEKLKSLGILNSVPSSINKKDTNRKSANTPKPPQQILKVVNHMPRRSTRLLGLEPRQYTNITELKDEDFEKTGYTLQVKEKVRRENVFGAIEGIDIGTVFLTRLEASHAGIHRPTVAGIHGNPNLGCYSLVMSGGYEDDEDLGYSFTYTGEGGRDLKGTKTNPKNLRTAPQSKDQVLERGNLALSRNIENGRPVRVLRGYKLNSAYAPTEGYRYDGLYKVVDYVTTTGKAGFTVFRFKLERLENQDPLVFINESEMKENAEE